MVQYVKVFVALFLKLWFLVRLLKIENPLQVKELVKHDIAATYDDHNTEELLDVVFDNGEDDSKINMRHIFLKYNDRPKTDQTKIDDGSWDFNYFWLLDVVYHELKYHHCQSLLDVKLD